MKADGMTIVVKRFKSKCSICGDAAYYYTRQEVHRIPRYRFYCEKHMKEAIEEGFPKGTFLFHIKYEYENE